MYMVSSDTLQYQDIPFKSLSHQLKIDKAAT